jgi:hypothetical protein
LPAYSSDATADAASTRAPQTGSFSHIAPSFTEYELLSLDSLLELLWRERLVFNDWYLSFSQTNVHCSRMFSRLVARFPFRDRKFDLAPLSQLAELNTAQTCDVKKELSAILAFDEAELARRI